MHAIDQIKSLNDLPRTGWVMRGIRDPETVGEHTAESVAILYAMADKLGDDFDLDRTADMLGVHDWPESKQEVGDITIHCGVPANEKFRREKAAMVELCSTLENGPYFLELWLEFEAQLSVEARIARQIDKFQMLYKAAFYHAEQGMDPSDFFNNDGPKVTHPALVAVVDRLREAVSMRE